MNKCDAEKLLQQQIDRAEPLIKVVRFCPEFKGWRTYTLTLIRRIFGNDSAHISEFDSISYSLSFFTGNTPAYAHQDAYTNGLRQSQQLLKSFIEEINTLGLPESIKEHTCSSVSTTHILEKFYSVQRQLRSRHSDRPTLEITDEYDVQDLLHALLKLVTDDIRAEEWTPSYAGGCSRMDFLLKDEQTVIETKITRKSLTGKQIGEELIIDIARYKTHPNWKKLICFVYDPEGKISNPAGLEKDLTGTYDGFSVTVLVRPKA